MNFDAGKKTSRVSLQRRSASYVVVPVWFLLYLIPCARFGIVLLITYLLDALVLTIALRLVGVHLKIKLWGWTSLKVWMTGLVCRFLAAVVVYGIMESVSASGPDAYDSLYNALLADPFRNAGAIGILIMVIGCTGLILYAAYRKISLARLPIPPDQKRTLALLLALGTAPYFFLFPSYLFGF